MEVEFLHCKLAEIGHVAGTLTDQSKIIPEVAAQVLNVPAHWISRTKWCVEQGVFASPALRKPHGYKVVAFLIALQQACEAEYSTAEQQHENELAGLIAEKWHRYLTQLGDSGAVAQMRKDYHFADDYLKRIINQAYLIAKQK